MQKRPALSEQSLLAHIFSPKKNPLPTGLRACAIALSKGRKAARVNAYNKMPAVKQEILKRSGKRDAFLSGNITFTDAKKSLREIAVEKGVAKPVRVRAPRRGKDKPRVGQSIRRQSVERANEIALSLLATLRRAGKDPVVPTVVAGSNFIQEDDAETLDYEGIKERARDKGYEMIINGSTFNPYWYN